MREDPAKLGWEAVVVAILRPSLLLAFWACLACAAGMTLLATWPHGVDDMAHLLARVHHRHHHPSDTELDEAHLRATFAAIFYACWAACAVLAVGLLLSWRLLFGGLHHWGTRDRF